MKGQDGGQVVDSDVETGIGPVFLLAETRTKETFVEGIIENTKY